jgi:hypothetical protein|tara:strand:- start:15459 stop:16334 length:876 start_codon:yes stop_codon:yes gene_type:complete
MRGELNRINPTIVEGAEDIFGADERLTNIMNRPKIASRESKRRIGNRLTSKQMNKLQTMMKSRPVANAESFEGQGCGCGGGNCQCAENFEARTYRRTPQRAKNSPSKGKAAGKVRRGRKGKRQGYNDKMDESMGKGNPMKASRKDRRDESKGMEKSMGNRAYSRVQTMDAETFEAPASEENMVDEGSVDAFYGGGRKVAVSSDGITPTTNPSVDEAFNVGNDVGLDVAEQEVMNVNPSVEVNYGADGIGETDVVSTVQDLTSKLGFRVNGLVASALVIGIASMAGYRYAKR